VSLRWPLVRSSGEVADFVEPLATLSWSSVLGEPPDVVGDALRPELDETSLSPLSRPIRDKPPEGASLGLGLAWTRKAPSYSSTFVLGRSVELADSAHHTAWFLTSLLELPQGLAMEGRTQLDQDGSLGVSEARIDWSNAMARVAASYVRVGAERPDSGEEVSLDTEFRPSERWSVRTEARYDLDDDRPRRLALGLGWRSECVEVDVSLARRYTSADGGGPSTEFGFSVGLLGFSTAGEARVTPGACRGRGRE
jgi:LPS-assembly protein